MAHVDQFLIDQIIVYSHLFLTLHLANTVVFDKLSCCTFLFRVATYRPGWYSTAKVVIIPEHLPAEKFFKSLFLVTNNFIYEGPHCLIIHFGWTPVSVNISDVSKQPGRSRCSLEHLKFQFLCFPWSLSQHSVQVSSEFLVLAGFRLSPAVYIIYNLQCKSWDLRKVCLFL